MRNRLTKTIVLIVFVVFLGIFKTTNVNAVAMGCYYRGDDYTMILNVTETFEGKVISLYNLNDNLRESQVTIRWTGDDSSNWTLANGVPWFRPTHNTHALQDNYGWAYTGYADAWYNENCPQRAIIVEYKPMEKNVNGGFWERLDNYNIDTVTGRKYVFFSTAEILNRWNGYINNYPPRGAASVDRMVTLNLEASSSTSSFNTRPLKVNQKKCKCNNDKGSTTFTISRGFPAPSVRIMGASAVSVGNWSTYVYPNSKTGNSRYIAMSDIASTNTCPTNLIVTTGSQKVALFSNSANKDVILSDLQNPSIYGIRDNDIEVYSCEVDLDSPLTDPTFTKPPYQNPGVNNNIVTPLDSDGASLTCGDGFMTGIHRSLPRASSLVFIILQVVAPIILVIAGTVDFMKAITSQKEDEIKKDQQTFIKRLIAAAILFFVFAILKFVVSIFSDDSRSIVDCMNCFLNGPSQCEVE